ncbi:uncharacterized protein AB675_2345 [Cyphellophora attinorum]|uniref:Uncharacterized protein n=1 Tax=Cyphellophora attinorum TaxID=1664694 RepID=A0A0N1HH99_9EURO|nr:uncharacterized protein AB675_2345 [Phialophora attinorum]KPI45290.1 hypothetical protein AB675_2345 [Phialophora attinorum]
MPTFAEKWKHETGQAFDPDHAATCACFLCDSIRKTLQSSLDLSYGAEIKTWADEHEKLTDRYQTYLKICKEELNFDMHAAKLDVKKSELVAKQTTLIAEAEVKKLEMDVKKLRLQVEKAELQSKLGKRPIKEEDTDISL